MTRRAATPSDRDLLYRIYASTRDDVLSTPWDVAQRTTFLEMQFRAQHTDYETRFPAAEHSIIVVDDTDAGRIWIDRRVDEIRLLDIALLPEWRDRGIGDALLRELIDEAQATQVHLRHSVHVDNAAALRFYRRLGFDVVDDFGTHHLMEWSGSGPQSSR